MGLMAVFFGGFSREVIDDTLIYMDVGPKGRGDLIIISNLKHYDHRS